MSRGRPFRVVMWIAIAVSAAVLGLRVSSAPGQESQAAPESQAGRGSQAAKAPVNADQGKRLFEQNCAVCHGADAGGGDGPDLQQAPAALGDAVVEGIIRRGVPGTAMPSFFNLQQSDAANIVAYLRTLGEQPGAGAIHGDPQKGQAVYQSSGCSGCHMIAGSGGEIGPDLTRIGIMRGPSNLKARLEDPAANLPKEGGIGDRGKWTLYPMFRAVEKDGHVIEGIRVGQDSFTIVLKDAAGNFHELYRPDLRSLEMEPQKSLMPSFKNTLSPEQMDDLIAYLMTLKGLQ